MKRPSRFEHTRFLGDKRTQLVYDLDEWTDEDGTALGGRDHILREIRITLLHELGHHFGLEEDDLERLGYA